MVKLGILFTYHKNGPVTQQNLDSLIKHNPDSPIVPICTSDKSNYIDHPNNVLVPACWHMVDLAYYSFALEKAKDFDCSHWMLAEWDLYCTCPILPLFPDLENIDFLSSNVHTYPSSWPWFSQVGLLSDNIKKKAKGISPLVTTILSQKAFLEISLLDSNLKLDVFCELRIATLASLCDIPITRHKLLDEAHLSKNFDFEKRSLFHPVKFMI